MTEAKYPFPIDPFARNIRDLVTPRQIVMIRSHCKELGIDPKEKLTELLPSIAGIKITETELTRQAAKVFIDYLEDRIIYQ